MAFLLSVLACEDTAISSAGRLTLINVFRDVASAAYPARVDRLKIVTTWLCRGEGVRERILILDPDGNVIADSDAEFRSPLLHTHVTAMDGLILPAAGEYTIRVYGGASPVAELPFSAVVMEEGQ